MTCSPGKRVEGDRHGFPPAALPTPAALSVAPPIGRRLCSVWLLLAPVRLLRRPPSAPYAAFFFGLSRNSPYAPAAISSQHACIACADGECTVLPS